MMTLPILIASLLLSLPALAQEANHAVSLTNPMIADISRNTVEIRSDFNGTQLLVFGVRNVPGDLVIVVRGPTALVTLRRKERIAGMWMHVDQRKYDKLPLFYAIASTKPLSRIAPPSTLQSLGLGESRIILTANSVPDDIFDKALDHTLSTKNWWQAPFTKITYFGETLFKAKLEMPDTLPSGDYTAEVYLFNRGKLLGFQTIPLITYKTGFDARIYKMAQKNGLLYGILAISMALFGGGLAHRLFRR
ncbi:MAG: TIGR02186 family protein [Pseudomonadota bacterium]